MREQVKKLLAALLVIIAFAFVCQSLQIWNIFKKENKATETASKADGSKIDPMDVVLIVDTSGKNKFIGSEMASGFQDALNTNSVSDLIRMVIRDSGGRTEAASALADGAAAGYRTLAIVGPSEAVNYPALNTAAKEGQVATIIPIGALLAEKNNKWSFSLMAPRFKRGQFAGRLIQQISKAKNITRIVPDGTPNDGIWNGLLKDFSETEIESLDITYWPKDPKADKIREAISDILYDDVILISLPMSDAEIVVKQLKLFGYTGQIMVEGEASLPQFSEQFAKEPKEIIKPGYFTDDLVGLTPFIPSIAGPESQKLIQLYKDKKHKNPSWAYAYGYDCGLLISEYVKTSKINKSFDLANPDKLRNGIVEFLERLNTNPNQPIGFSGRLSFNDNHTRELPPKVITFHNKKQLPYYLQFSNEAKLRTNATTDDGNVIIGDEIYKFVPVVYTGMIINKIESVDFDAGKFTATVDLSLKSRENIDISDILFQNLIGDLKSTKLLEEIRDNGTIFKHYRISGEFEFTPLPSDIVLDHANFYINWRHKTKGAEQLKFVVDDDYQGLKVFKERDNWNTVNIFENEFTMKSSDLSVDEEALPAPGDPRNLNGVMKYSAAEFNGDFVRPATSLTSKLINSVGQEKSHFIFVLFSVAFLVISLISYIFPTVHTITASWFMLFSTAYLSKAVFFTSENLSLIEPAFVKILRLSFDIIYIFAITQFVDSLFVNFLAKRSQKKDNQPVITFLARFGLYFGAVSYFYTVILGKDILPFLATASVGLAVVGLALQGLIFDAIAGIVLNLDGALSTGQRVNIKIADNYIYGTVEQLGWRYVLIRSDDDKANFVPNSSIVTQVLSNLSLKKGFSGIEIPFAMGLQRDVSEVIPVLVSSLKKILANDPSVDATRDPSIIIRDLDKQSMKCAALIFYESTLNRDPLFTKVLETIRNVLVAEGAVAGEEPLHIKLDASSSKIINQETL